MILRFHQQKGVCMSEINLEEGKIKHEGKWISAEDLTNMIQEKMSAGDMKIANLAAVLEKLNNALENSHTLDIKLVLTKDDYKKLQKLGGGDDRDAVRKALMAFIGGPSRTEPPAPAPEKKKAAALKCPKCKSPLEVTDDDRPLQIECQNCGTEGIITADNKWVRHE